MISYYDLLGMIQNGNEPKKIEVRLCSARKVVYKADYDADEFSHYRIDDYEDENYHTYLSECLLESSMFDKCIKILDGEKEIEIPQEFLKDVTAESEIVLIKDDIGHDYGYKNSIGFITNRTSYENSYYIFGFDKRANRWWECGFNEDDYIRTGLFVSDLFRPFAILTPSKEDEFEDIESFGIHYSWDYIDYKNIEELKKYVNKDFQNIFDTLDKLIKNQKKLIERSKNENN